MRKLLLGVLLLIGANVFSQAWTFPVSGRVTKGGKKLDGAVVTLLKSGNQVNQITTNFNGKFEFVLEPNAEYIITVTKSGYITKRFSFSTLNVPEERAKKGFGGVDLSEIVIFEIPKDVDVNELNSILSQPIAKFAFQSAAQDFNYDEGYTQSIRSKLDKLGEAQKKAEEEQKKKADEEKRKIDGDHLIADKYAPAIAKADKAFAAKDYTGARAGYMEASTIKPTETYPQGKLKEIDAIFAKEKSDKENAAKDKELNDKYTAALASADKAFASKDFTNAKTGYNQALGFKPAEKYPKDKLAEIDKTLADAAAKETANKAAAEKYATAIAKGDKALLTKDYSTSKAGYTEALGIKPGEKYPKDKLAEIDKLQADAAAKELAEKDKAAKEKELNERYAASIAKADKSFTAKDYPAAKTGYTEATGIKPTEKYPKDKIAEIDKILGDLAAKDAAEKDKLAKEKELNEKYKAAIDRADKAFSAKEYAGAKSGYTEASGLKGTEKYPKDKLIEVEKLLALAVAKDMADKANASKEKELNDKYTASIAKADQAFAAKDYTAAKTGYKEATVVKPTESYPKEKIVEIDKLLADAAAKTNAEKDKAAKEAKEKEQDSKYTAAIAKADKALSAKDYVSSKAGYNEALVIKPMEKYPKDKIAEIDRVLAESNAKAAEEKEKAAKEKELNAKYTAAITRGDKALTASDLTGAKVAFTEASGIKPSETYPKDKLAEIEKRLAELSAVAASQKEKATLAAKDKELNDKYKSALAKADKAFTAKDYLPAKAAYNEAATLKLTEEYPKTQLAEIEKILTKAANKEASDKEKVAKEKEMNEKYGVAIARANKLLAAKDYENAKSGYNEALTYKPFEQLPKDKLAEIQRLMEAAVADNAKAAKDKELNEKYASIIASADKSYTAKDYTSAKSAYTDALGLKPAEKYPKDKLAEIEKIFADQAAKENLTKAAAAKTKEVDERYTETLAKAEDAFKAKSYPVAQALYSNASSIKPSERYPKDKLMEIEHLLDEENAKKEEAGKQQKYNDLISKGDKQYAAKEYKAAKLLFQQASGMKPSEKYPKDKIAQIDDKLSAMKSATVTASIVPPKDNDPEKKKQYVNALVTKYPQGVTEEEFQEGNCKVLKRVVVKGDNAATYKKSIWAWGGVFYFKDDVSITEAAFNSETQ